MRIRNLLYLDNRTLTNRSKLNAFILFSKLNHVINFSGWECTKYNLIEIESNEIMHCVSTVYIKPKKPMKTMRQSITFHGNF